MIASHLPKREHSPNIPAAASSSIPVLRSIPKSWDAVRAWSRTTSASGANMRWGRGGSLLPPTLPPLVGGGGDAAVRAAPLAVEGEG